jgi:hypothetical protein
MPRVKCQKHCEMQQLRAYTLGTCAFAGHPTVWFLISLLVGPSS